MRLPWLYALAYVTAAVSLIAAVSPVLERSVG